MHLNPLLLVSLSLLTPGFSAPTNPHVKISIATDTSIGAEICLRLLAPPGEFCSKNVGPDWAHTCCKKVADDKADSSAVIDLAFEVSTTGDACLRAWFPEGFDCAARYGPKWYYKGHACCQRSSGKKDSSSSIIDVSVSAPGASKNGEVCLPNFFQPSPDCAGRFGPEWYFNHNTCCKKIDEDNIALYSPEDVPAHENSEGQEVCHLNWYPLHFNCARVFGSGWYYNEKTKRCCIEVEEESNVNVQVSFMDGMPTGFGSESSVRSNVDAHGEMPTGFESKSRVDSYENIHTEML
ncbi:hypothetical protein BKA65DRAFT_557277 [Rhexocercosporidium sp. MPI-PUGE-AT-0058]|nr:hypothetical protein BKA65DRAFT_557277 [Rhexocercosporidium sp. MPI-PUGE-AT-0058]